MANNTSRRPRAPHARLLALFVVVPILVCSLPLGLAYFLISSSETATLSGIEEQTLGHDAVVARQSLASHIAALERVVSDYGQWDQMQQAVRSKDSGFLRDNIDASVLATYRLSSVLVFDSGRHAVYTRGTALSPAALPPAILASAGAASTLILPSQPALVVSSPVEREKAPLDRDGTLVFIQRIDGALVRDLAASTSNPIAVVPASGDALASSSKILDAALLARVRTAAADQRVVRFDSWSVVSSPIMPELGRRGPLLVVIASRQVTLSAERDLRARALVSFGVVLALAVLGGFVLSRWVVWPLALLSTALRSLTQGKAAAPVAPARWGVMDDLLQGFNQLASSLDVIVRERVVAETRERLAAIVESVPDAIISTDLNGIIDSWNAGATRLYGFPAQEAVGQPISIIAAPEQHDRLARLLAAATSGQTASTIETVQQSKDGMLLDVVLTMAPIRDASGAASGAACIARDIGERLRTESALRESEAQYRLLAEHATDLIARLSLRGVFIFVSPASLPLLGYLPEELVGRASPDYWHPEEHDSNLAAFEAIVSQPGPQTVTHRMRHKDGHYVWLETIFQTVRDAASGELTELHTTSRDLTARMTAEAALQATETRLRAVVSHAPLVLFALDGEGRLTFFESTLPPDLDPLGHPNVGDSLFTWLPSPGLVELGRRAAAGDVIATTVEIGDRAFEVWWTPEQLGTGEVHGGTGVAIDITETVRAQREAERARQAAVDLARLRSDFVASVSHELRTPLTSIIGYGEILQAHWDQFSDTQRQERLGRIVLSANRQKRLVEDLLLLTRLDSGIAPPRLAPVTLAAVAERVAAEVTGTYPGQRIDLDGAADLQALGDQDWTAQILTNLVDNAAKYSSEGSDIGVAWSLEGTKAVVRVRDRGCGIAQDSRELLFTRFGRVAGSHIRAGHVGTGLGLYLSRHLARAMDGDLDLEKTGPTGSTFRLRLPASLIEG